MIKFVLKIERNTLGIPQIIYHKTNKEALTVLCLGNKALRKRLEHQRSGKKHETTSNFLPKLLSCSSRFLRAEQ